MPQVLPPYIVFMSAESLVIWQADESFFWHMKHSPQPMLKPATLRATFRQEGVCEEEGRTGRTHGRRP